ncbi:hypothetical protein EV359DRAFT_67780 [Lentinula novae-zelandiae]|nr:hypothetical protein EV359DRAFT_67780 [Lentinula novae-zelandiae]
MPSLTISSSMWIMTANELKEKLTRLTVIAQRSMDYASHHRLVNQDTIRLLQPYYDGACALWENYWLRVVPAMTDSDARRKWFRDVDEVLREDRSPGPDDLTSWCLRAFLAFAALEAMHTHDMSYLSDEVNGSINQHVMRESCIQVTGRRPPTLAPQPGPPTGSSLVGTKLRMRDPNTFLDTEYTIVDFAHSTFSGYIYVLEFVASEGPQTRIVSQGELEELSSQQSRWQTRTSHR